MSEPLTSNPLGCPHGSVYRSACVQCLTAEIERLTAELAGTKDELYSVDKAAKELVAERDRLRAALERISQWYPSKQSQAGEVAREALARAAVETTGQQFGPGPCGFSNTYGRCILMRGHDGKHELQ